MTNLLFHFFSHVLLVVVVMLILYQVIHSYFTCYRRIVGMLHLNDHALKKLVPWEVCRRPLIS